MQRDNAEMERRCQEVIDRAWELGEANPIISIHDVGAGGLSNALPELVNDSARGATFSLRAIPSDEPGMSPLEIWCNEAQERYVLAIAPESLPAFEALCKRERCPYAVVGVATSERRLKLDDAHFAEQPIDMPLDVLLGKPPKMTRQSERGEFQPDSLKHSRIELGEALLRVLRLPTVADKTFLITISDRTVGGLCSRDQMVGPWQVPVADAAVTTSGFQSYTGEAMAMGERAPLALLSAGASARMAVAEAITNIAAAPIARLSDVKLSANWMAAAGHPGEDARLYEAVQAVGGRAVPGAGIAIPVGKDRCRCAACGAKMARALGTAPLSLIVSAFAPVTDVRRCLTPSCRARRPEQLLLVDLGRGKNRLGGSAVLQVHGSVGEMPPDLDDPATSGVFSAPSRSGTPRPPARLSRSLRRRLLVTLLEWRRGFGRPIRDARHARRRSAGGAVRRRAGRGHPGPSRRRRTRSRNLGPRRLSDCVHDVGPCRRRSHRGRAKRHAALQDKRSTLRGVWSETTHAMQRLRDDAASADEEHALRLDPDNAGLSVKLSFGLDEDVAAPFVARSGKSRPRVAILREQGVNGQLEMAAAFDRAGFSAIDVHMSDLLEGRRSLKIFRFSGLRRLHYGDVLGAGGVGKVDLLQGAHAKNCRSFRAYVDLHARCVQRLPNLSNLAELSPRRRVPALRAQPLRAIRGAPQLGAHRADPLGLASGYGRLLAADRRRPRRRSC